MFSRSAMVFAATAAVELLVVALAVSRIDVLLLLLVVAAISAFGSIHLFEQMDGVVHQSREGVMSYDPRENNALGGPVLLPLSVLPGPPMWPSPAWPSRGTRTGPRTSTAPLELR